MLGKDDKESVSLSQSQIGGAKKSKAKSKKKKTSRIKKAMGEQMK